MEDELEHLVADLKARVKEEGVPFEKFLLQTRKTEQDIRAEWRPIAERRAKSLLVIDAIARKEGVTVSGNELAAQAAMSPLAQVDAQALRSPQVLVGLGIMHQVASALQRARDRTAGSGPLPSAKTDAIVRARRG